MSIDCSKRRSAVRFVALRAGCGFVLGLVVFGTAASSPNPRRDVSIDFPSDLAATASADRTLLADAQTDLKKEESFTHQTKVVEYRFRLEGSSDVVHLNISAEVEHGLVRWELIDPTGEVRANIGTTEHASMNTTNIQAIKGEWVLRIGLQDASGRYKIHWVR
jgi:hypothetical protein